MFTNFQQRRILLADILKENSSDKEIKVLDFVKYKVGEGV